MQIHILDIVIFVVFTLGTVLFGISFFRKNKNVSDYTEAGGSVPGFIVGMSIFATYVSSISFLGLPGSAYSGNWNSFVFSLSLRLIASFLFLSFFRNDRKVQLSDKHPFCSYRNSLSPY
jgi:SSS family solute:Na+ symporter